MKQSITILALLGVSVDARHYRQSFAQATADPWNPAASRAAFEKARAAAAATVATQQAFEATKTADVASRNTANTQETFNLKRKVRDARQNQIENDVHHQQWVTRSNFSNWAQTPEDSRKAFEAGLANSDKVVQQQQATESTNVSSSDAAQEKYAKQTFDKNVATTAARINQIRNEVKPSRDSRGWRLVWPVGSLSQNPDEAAAAKDKSLQNSNSVVKAQQSSEGKLVTEIESAHTKSAEQAAEKKLGVVNAQDDQKRGGVRATRDSLGWSVAQQEPYSTIGQKGQIPMVQQFLTPDYDNNMRGFIQKQDLMGDEKIDESVYHFTQPLIIAGGAESVPGGALAQKMDLMGDTKIDESVYHFTQPLIINGGPESVPGGALAQRSDTIGTAGYDEKVQAFVRPNIAYLNNDTNYDNRQTLAQDTIGAAGLDEKVHAFVKPNIVYLNNDVNYLQEKESFLGNPERVSVIDPIAYQTKANKNTLDDIQIRRTTFYDKKNNLWRQEANEMI